MCFGLFYPYAGCAGFLESGDIAAGGFFEPFVGGIGEGAKEERPAGTAEGCTGGGLDNLDSGIAPSLPFFGVGDDVGGCD